MSNPTIRETVFTHAQICMHIGYTKEQKHEHCEVKMRIDAKLESIRN